MAAFTKFDTLNDLGMFGTWRKRIVINNSVYDYHKKETNKEVPLDDVFYKIEDDDGATEDYEWTHLKAAEIVPCMKTLKDNYRIGLTLLLIEGYDYEEISDIMNMSYGNCRTMISRAKDSLRQKLELTIEF